MVATDDLGPTFETARLILRPPRLDDFEAWAAFLADAERTRYLGGPLSRPLAWRAMMSMIGAWAACGVSMFSVIEKRSGRWIGRLGPWSPEGWPGTEVGWSIIAAAGGKGYATEGATAAMDWAFDGLGWTDVIHTIDPDNAASKAVAAKLGSRFLRMGDLPDPHAGKPVEIWGQTRAQWRARRR